MMKLYVKAPSKKALNEMLKTDQVTGTCFAFDRTSTYDLSTLQAPAVIAIYQKAISGNPVATSYGEYDPKTRRVK